MRTQGEWEVYRGHDNFFIDESYILAPMDTSNPERSRPDKCVAIVKFITKEQTEANAQYIVQCVNSHEGLVKVCQSLYEELTTILKDEDCDHSVGICWCDTFRALDDAVAALKKARGE